MSSKGGFAAQAALKGTLIAIVITVPSLIAFFIGWKVLDDLMIGLIAGVIVNFIAIGFSLKITRKFLTK